MSSSTTRAIQSQFTAAAGAYTYSSVHAAGPDLALPLGHRGLSPSPTLWTIDCSLDLTGGYQPIEGCGKPLARACVTRRYGP